MIFCQHTAAFQLMSPYATAESSAPSKRELFAASSVSRHDFERLSSAGFPEPHHALVLERNHFHRVNHATVHVCTQKLPPHSFQRCRTPGLTNDLVASPGLCFVQLGTALDLPQLVRAGNELCGRFGYWSTEGLVFSRKPIASTTSIARYIRALGPINGKPRAQQALAYVCDGAASPREALLAALFTLPRSRGGFGLPRPSLNHRVGIPARYRRLFNQAHYECDLYWPSGKVAIEYDSDQYHTGTERIAHDATRRNALALLGIEIISVTNQQLFDAKEIDRVARIVAKRIGKPLRYNQQYDTYARQSRLLMDYLGSTPLW